MRSIEWLIRRHAGLVLLTFAGLSLLCVGGAARLTIDGSVERLMMSGDPARADDERAKNEFGNDEIIMIAFDLGAAYTQDDLRKLRTLSERIGALEGVRRVRDLSSTEDVRDVDGVLDASPLIDFELLAERFPEIRARAAEHRLYSGRLLSADEEVFGMLVYAESTRANDQAVNDLTGEVIALVDAFAPPWQAYYAGYPVTAFEVNRIVKRDLALLTPLALLLVSLALALYTRRLFPVALFVAVVVWVELVALAWLGATGAPINVVISTLPTILIATSGTYIVYTIGLLRHVSADPEPALALLRLLAKPVMLSMASTVIGFGSLVWIDIQSVGELGMALAVGIVAAGVATLLLVPAWLHRFDLRLDARSGGAIDATLQNLSTRCATTAHRPWPAILLALLAILVAAPGLMRLRVHTDTLQYFAEDNRVRAGADFLQERLASGFLLNVVVRSPENGRALDADVLGFVETLQTRIEALPNVDRTLSLLDYFELIDAAVRAEPPALRNPGSREIASQYLLLYESGGDPDDLERYVNFDRSALSLIVSIHGGSRAYLEAAAQIDEWASTAPVDLRVDTLGTTFLYSKAMEELTRGMFRGLAVATLLITLVLAIGLRSWRLAALASIPNVLPIAITGGALGWLGIPISMSTSLMGCIALGLAVDDTAHVMGHFSPRASLTALYRVVGPALILTTACLGLGFAALLASDFAFVSVLGASVIVTLLLALAADLLVLPALLAVWGRQEVAAARRGAVLPPTAQHPLSGEGAASS